MSTRLTFASALAVAAMGCTHATSEDVAATASPQKVCATDPNNVVQGVDVSHHNGTVDWNAVAGAGVAFAFARISDGTGTVDHQFQNNWPAMKAAGVIRGAYQYFRASDDPGAQADLVVSSLQQAGGLEAGDLPVVLDVETSDGQDPSTVAANMQVWLDKVAQQTGKKPIVYTSKGTWPGGGDFSAYTLWVANYGTSCPSMPEGWSTWKFWQLSESGSVAGISGGTDLDEFDGSLADLRAFAGASPNPPPPPSSQCQSDADCSGGQVCSQGSCAAPPPPNNQNDAVTRAEQWVQAQLQYCQAPNGQPDNDAACASTCQRTSNPDWDPYRSDCSGLISWAWGLPPPGLTTGDFAPHGSSSSQIIQASDLQPGDACNRNNQGHIVLFKEWAVAGQRATFIEEPGCSSSQPYAREFTSDVSLNAENIDIQTHGATFTAIRYAP